MLNVLRKSTSFGNALLVFFAISLLFVQVFHLHAHLSDHQHDVVEYHAHQPIAIHSDIATSKVDHHNENVTVKHTYLSIDRSVAIKSLFSMAVTVILWMVLPIVTTRRAKVTTRSIFPPPKRYSLSPPLRAPPLH